LVKKTSEKKQLPPTSSKGAQINGALGNLLGELALKLYEGRGFRGDLRISRRIIPSVMSMVCATLTGTRFKESPDGGIRLTKKIEFLSETDFLKKASRLNLPHPSSASAIEAFAISDPGIIIKVKSPVKN